MTTLPSFVELMESLGLDQASEKPERPPSPIVTASSPTAPTRAATLPNKSRSNPALREQSVMRTRVARYSPYSPALSPRRGSISNGSLENDAISLRASSISPHRSPPLHTRRISGNSHLNVETYESTTAISSLVRHRTPGTSPISPNFSSDTQTDSSIESPQPFVVALPTLPDFFSNQPPSPTTSDSDFEPSDMDSQRTPIRLAKSCDCLNTNGEARRRLTGVRLSAARHSGITATRNRSAYPPSS